MVDEVEHEPLVGPRERGRERVRRAVAQVTEKVEGCAGIGERVVRRVFREIDSIGAANATEGEGWRTRLGMGGNLDCFGRERRDRLGDNHGVRARAAVRLGQVGMVQGTVELLPKKALVETHPVVGNVDRWSPALEGLLDGVHERVRRPSLVFQFVGHGTRLQHRDGARHDMRLAASASHEGRGRRLERAVRVQGSDLGDLVMNDVETGRFDVVDDDRVEQPAPKSASVERRH